MYADDFAVLADGSRQDTGRWRWKDVRRQFTGRTGRWRPITAGQIELRRIAAIPVTRYRYRGTTIPGPWTGTAAA